MSKQSRQARQLARQRQPIGRDLIIGLLVASMVAVGLLTFLYLRPLDRVLYRGELTIIAGKSWQPDECRRLRTIIQASYPRLVKLYGPPSSVGQIIVERTTSRTSDITPRVTNNGDGTHTVIVPSNIDCSERVFEFPLIIVHELAHYFHHQHLVILAEPPVMGTDRSAIYSQHEAIEEGMAQAAAVIIARELGYSTAPFEPIYLGTDFNRPVFSYMQHRSGRGLDNYCSSQTVYLLRAELAARAFIDQEQNQPGFLARLNSKLYELPVNIRPIDADRFVAAGEAVCPGFNHYFHTQHIFNPLPLPGPQLFVVGDQQTIIVGRFDRSAMGEETAVADQPCLLTVVGEDGKRYKKRFQFGLDGCIQIKMAGLPARYVATVESGALKDRFTYR